MRNRLRFAAVAGLILFLLGWNLSGMAAEDYTGLQYAFGTQGIRVPAWNQPGSRNAEGVVAAILDSGVDVNHPDLKEVMWKDGLKYPSLRALGGGMYGISVDEDAEDSTVVIDQAGHGTHVAGIVGAAWNGFGISGGANGVRLMTVQTGLGDNPRYEAVLRALKYVLAAKKAGVPVAAVNLSWGGSLVEASGGSELNDLVMELGEAGIVTVVAAGNGGINLDFSNHTALWLRTNPYVLVVGNATRQREASSGSQYSERVVHVFAPGENILSTVPLAWQGPDEEEDEDQGDETGYTSSVSGGANPWKRDDPDQAYYPLSGTSMATPAVTAMVAVLARKFPGESADRLAARVVGTAVQEPALQGKCITGGIASLDAALSREPLPVPQQALCGKMEIRICGHFFGQQTGMLLIDGRAAQVLTWSDHEITAEVPPAFTGRDCRVSVRTANGKSGSRIMDFTGSVGKLEAVVPEGMREMNYIRSVSMVGLGGKLYVAGNNDNESGTSRISGRLYCIDPEAGSCRRLATFPEMIKNMCVFQDQLVLLADRTLYVVSADGDVRRQVSNEPYLPLMAAQAGRELVLLCTLEGQTKLCVLRGSGLEELYVIEGICQDAYECTDVAVDENTAYFLYKSGGILQVSADLTMTERQLPVSEDVPLTLEMADGIPWVGLSSEKETLTLCPAEKWEITKSKGYVPSSELFLRPHTAVLGDYLYLLSLTPSLKWNLVLRRIRLREAAPVAISLPSTGDPDSGWFFPALLTLFLSALGIRVVQRGRG